MTDKRPIANGLMCINAWPSSLNSSCKDLQGVFNYLCYYGFPVAFRWKLVITIINPPEEKVTLYVRIKRKDAKDEVVGIEELCNSNGTDPMSLIVDLFYEFQSDGCYELYCTFVDDKYKETEAFASFPLVVKKLKIPSFTIDEMNIIKSHSDILKHRDFVTIQCENCNHLYVFEDNVINNQDVSMGALAFPENGVYSCDSCGKKINLLQFLGSIRQEFKQDCFDFLAKK